MPKKEEIVKPFEFDTSDGTHYSLTFTKESVAFAEARGFVQEDLRRFPVTAIPDLFYYAFRANHKGLSRTQTDAILENELCGLTPEEMGQLNDLFTMPALAFVRIDGEETKNRKATVRT